MLGTKLLGSVGFVFKCLYGFRLANRILVRCTACSPNQRHVPRQYEFGTNYDWLTKILVGVGLTQIGKIPSALRSLAGHISKSFGVSGNDVFSVSMVLYFSTLGFLTGYLLTRLFLQQEFDAESTDKIELSTKGPTEVKVTQPGTDKAAADKATADQAAADQARADKATADQAAADQARADKATADQAAADQARADKATADQA